jgi:hypothetical protein
MMRNQLTRNLFSAIAAPFNLKFERDCANTPSRSPSTQRVCRAWHVTTQVQVLGPGFRRAEG